MTEFIEKERETVPKQVEQLVLCDLDRTLIKSDELVDIVQEFLIETKNYSEQTTKDLAELVMSTHQNAGESVQPYGVMRDTYGLELDPSVLADQIIGHFDIELLKKRLLIPGAEYLFDAMSTHNTEYAILTSATDVIGQKFKIALFERLIEQSKIPYFIINHEAKSQTAEDHWYEEDSGSFKVPKPDNDDNHGGWQAKKIVIIDDKTKNLRSGTNKVSKILKIHVFADGDPVTDAVDLTHVADQLAKNGQFPDSLRYNEAA